MKDSQLFLIVGILLTIDIVIMTTWQVFDPFFRDTYDLRPYVSFPFNKISRARPRTDKKENQIFLIYKEIQMGAVEKSYIRRGFLIYEEMSKYLVIFEEAISHIRLCNRSSLDFLINEENLICLFISAL
jgi:hypothetical protein